MLDTDRRFSQELVRSYADGELVFAEGDPGRELYIIQEGAVVIRKRTEVGDVDLVHFERGAFFGDMALLQAIPRVASAYAQGATKLLVLQPGGFLLKLRRDPTLAFEMIQQLSYRVKVTSEKFLEAVRKGRVPKEIVEEILAQAEKPHS